MGGFEGDWVEPKTNAVIEDANWRQRITSEIDAADSWTNDQMCSIDGRLVVSSGFTPGTAYPFGNGAQNRFGGGDRKVALKENQVVVTNAWQYRG